MNADITVKDVTGRFEIDAKSIVGLMTIRMGEKMHLLIEGEEEHLKSLTVILKNLTVHRLRFQLVKAALDMPEIYGTRSRKMEVPMIITVFFIMRQSIKVSHRRRQS